MADSSDDDEYSRSPKRIKLSGIDRVVTSGSEHGKSKSKAGSSGFISANARLQAANLVADLFAASTTTAHSNANAIPGPDSSTKINTNKPLALTGLVTPSPTLSNHAQAGEDESPQPRRHVSGPGEFTPRALLKSEEEFENIGIDAGAVLALHEDSISWWLAEQIVWIHQYLENPQKGRPTSLDARPRGRIKAGNGNNNGKDVNHCCPKGGVTHLKPCNMPRPPPASEAFSFATQMRDDLLPQHHASKGGINTIAVVGDIVLEKLGGCSKIDEEEFKLVAGSEHIRNFFGRGYKRYKLSDPHIDPTKQPILLLKSLKKASQSEALVTQLKARYAWALANYQGLIGPSSPGNQLLPFSTAPGSKANNKARSTPVKLAPAIKMASSSAKRDAPRHPSVLPLSKASESATPGHARGSTKPEFPLLGLSISDSAYASRVISEICDLLNLIFRTPLSWDTDQRPETLRPQVTPNKTNSSQPNGHKSRQTERRRSIDEGADLLLTFANGGPFKRDVSSSPDNESSNLVAAIVEEMPTTFHLDSRTRMDHVLKVLIEGVINTHIERQSHAPGTDMRELRALKSHLSHLKHLIGLADLRCNVVVTPQHSAAILRLFRTLLDQTKPGDAGSVLTARDTRQHDDDDGEDVS